MYRAGVSFKFWRIQTKRNNRVHIEGFRDKVINQIIQKTERKDIRDHIKEEKVITPREWKKDYNVYIAAEFNMGHNLNQMLYLRPHNEFGKLNNLGGGTHPVSGLATIYE